MTQTFEVAYFLFFIRSSMHLQIKTVFAASVFGVLDVAFATRGVFAETNKTADLANGNMLCVCYELVPATT